MPLNSTNQLRNIVSSASTVDLASLGGASLVGNTFTGPQTVNDTTNSTSTSTGAIITTGGAGIAKDVFIGGIINIPNTTSTTGQITQGGVPIFHTFNRAGSSLGNIFIGSTTAAGNLTLTGNTLGDNVCIGRATSPLLTTGYRNICIGASSGASLTVGNNNIAIGIFALSTTDGTNSVAIGSSSLAAATLGANVAIGHISGATITSGQQVTFVGYAADTTAAGANYQTVLGGSASTGAANATAIGALATATASYATSIGSSATNSTANSVQLGRADGSDVTIASGGVSVNVIGKTVTVKSGSNSLSGTFTANGTTPVAVATTAWDANSVVIITLKTAGGAGTILQPFVSSVTPGTGFSVTAGAADTSVYNWVALKVG